MNQLHFSPGHHEIVARLRPAGSLSGRVHGGDPFTVLGIALLDERGSRLPLFPNVRHGRDVVPVDAKGDFQVALAPTGAFTLAVVVIVGVEQGIILAIEESIRGLDGIKEINARASESFGTVTVELSEGADTQRVYQDIKQQVDRIITFPKDLVKEPWNYNLITRFDIIPNIVAGTISEDSAILGYEFDGEEGKLELAIAYLNDMGVKVEAVDEIRL